MKTSAPGQRLLSAVKYVRQGARFADVGTDHAYLPIYLLKKGLIASAVLSDINKGPLASAKENAADADVTDRVELVLCDGAAALADKRITDMAIFGMGGELIAQIIENAPFLKTERVRLILQPMSKHEHLCEYLMKSGFSIIGETYTSEGGKFYRTLCAEFVGSCNIEENFAYVGLSSTPCEEIDAKTGYLKAHLSGLSRALSGKASANLDSSDELKKIDIIKKELARLSEIDKQSRVSEEKTNDC